MQKASAAFLHRAAVKAVTGAPPILQHQMGRGGDALADLLPLIRGAACGIHYCVRVCIRASRYNVSITQTTYLANGIRILYKTNQVRAPTWGIGPQAVPTARARVEHLCETKGGRKGGGGEAEGSGDGGEGAGGQREP